MLVDLANVPYVDTTAIYAFVSGRCGVLLDNHQDFLALDGVINMDTHRQLWVP